MKKVITGVLFRGQPLYEEWNEARNVVAWSSRVVEGDYPTKWRLKHYVALAEVRVDNRLHLDTRLAAVSRAQLNLVRLPGMEIDKAHYKRLAASQAHPQPGDRIRGQRGPLRCLACTEGFVLARCGRKVPFVMDEESWNTHRLLDEGCFR
jgi:hypothetical protein